ncbi:hypothetical protein TSUD_120900 [Trifolium subterraneum]|uniref:RRM domain-containing protein n=1 Tax=Trifolium subterraneum TaxID=3900 RepID=A0A2Z6ME92_TRISU|nr:hypothetical protein TSUD_120900 [Trifolium subterraneum]
MAEDRMDKKTTTTTFYFTNFPDEVHLQEIIYRFSKFGDIEDIYIPEKRNKSGKHFGFVRFRGAKDVKLVEAKTKEVWFGTYKLWANVARFVKTDEGGRTKNREKREERKTKKMEGDIVKITKLRQENRRVESISYAEAAGGKAEKMKEQDNQRKQKENQKEWSGIIFESTEEDRSWAKKGLVGIVNHPEEVQMLQQKMLDVGLSTIRIIPMGGRKVFIQPSEDEDLWELIKDAEEYFNHWFVKIKEWNPSEVSVDRVVWIRIFGTPVHAWKEDFFKKMVESFGELLVLDWDTSQKRRLDFARVLIKTSYSSFINHVEKVKIDSLFFMVRVLEELEYNYGVRTPPNKQVSEFSEEEDSNSQPWFEKHEEEDDRDANSQNLEREYNSFNEAWEIEHSRGGAEQELLEAQINKCNSCASGNIICGNNKALDSLDKGSKPLHGDKLQENKSENLQVDNLGQKDKPNSNDWMMDPIVASKTHDPIIHSLALDLSIEELGAGYQMKHVTKEKEQITLSSDEHITISRGEARTQPTHHAEKEDDKRCGNCVVTRRRRRLFPKLKDLARSKYKKAKKRRSQISKDVHTMEEGVGISSSLNQVNVSLGSSISGEVSEWRKWVILHDQPERVAQKVWDFGKEVSLVCEKNKEGDLIRDLANIESRDRPEAANDSEHHRGAERITSGDH